MLERRGDSALDLIGHTPLVRIQHLAPADAARVYGKCEQFNPGGSVKDRIALAMIEAAEREGKLGPGSIVVEPTSGNTGIGLAIACAIKGYGCVLAMPDDMSHERRALLRLLGAELILTPVADGMLPAVEAAEELCRRDSRYFMPMQFENPANPRVHEETTGPEIIAALAPMRPHALVCGVGTGGTLTGVGRALRARWPDVRIVAVEPARSNVLSGGRPGRHAIQGIGAGFVPEVLDTSLIDEVVTVTDEEAWRTRELLARKEGLIVGISSGAAVAAALRVAERMDPSSVVVTILADTGERYLTMAPPLRIRPG